MPYADCKDVQVEHPKPSFRMARTLNHRDMDVKFCLRHAEKRVRDIRDQKRLRTD